LSIQVTKPTGLYEVGLQYLKKLWTVTPKQAEGEYGKLVDIFVKTIMEQPATHVSKIAETVEEALTTASPPLRYKVGLDSKISPILGLLPTGAREWIFLKMFEKQ